jgi:lipopolysaccharide transport system permease protein
MERPDDFASPRTPSIRWPPLGARADLLHLLVVREIRTRYARTALGVLWAVFPPVATAALFTALDFGRLIGGESRWKAIPYAAFAFSGMVFWTHFAQSLVSGTSSLALARDMLHKSTFPAELIPLSKVFAWMLDLGIGLGLLLALAWARGVPVHATAWIVPFVFALQAAFTIGVVLFLSALNLFFRDVQFVLQVVVTILMFASNVVVPIEGAPGPTAAALAFNPMVSYLDAYRSALFLGRLPDLAAMAPGIVGAVVALAGGWAYFRRVAPRFAEEV